MLAVPACSSAPEFGHYNDTWSGSMRFTRGTTVDATLELAIHPALRAASGERAPMDMVAVFTFDEGGEREKISIGTVSANDGSPSASGESTDREFVSVNLPQKPNEDRKDDDDEYSKLLDRVQREEDPPCPVDSMYLSGEVIGDTWQGNLYCYLASEEKMGTFSFRKKSDSMAVAKIVADDRIETPHYIVTYENDGAKQAVSVQKKGSSDFRVSSYG